MLDILSQFGWISINIVLGVGTGEGVQWWVERKTICWQKCEVFWQGLYLQEFPVAVESHQLMWWHHVRNIIVISVIVSVYFTKISQKTDPK